MSAFKTPLNSFLVLLISSGVVAVAPPAHAAAPTCHGERATIVGTVRGDRLTGTRGRDVILARGGDDVVAAGGGQDLVCGGPGADTLRGGRGDDRLYGQLDRIVSDRGGTRFEPDRLAGGPGDDWLDVGDDRRRDDAQGAHGILSYSSATRGVTVDLGGDDRRGSATGQGRDTIVVVPPPSCDYDCLGVVVLGSPHADRLRGSADPDRLIGNAGDDHLDGRAGDDELRAEGTSRPGPGRVDDDTLTGGPGADRLIGSVGRDSLFGDDGDDTVWSLGGGPSEVFGGSGDDEVVVWFPTRPAFMLDGGEGTDLAQILGPRRPGAGGRPEAATVRMSEGTVTAGGDTFGRLGTVEELVLGSGLQWTYHGTDASEVVRGSLTAPFRAWTYGGDDEVYGTDGSDRIDAGDGQDTVQGYDGRDTCLNAEVVRGCEELSP